MVGLKKILSFGDSQERELRNLLQSLHQDKTPIRLEIEEANVHFYTVLSVRRNMVVVAKPPGLQKELKRDGFVRFRVPGDSGKEVRLTVAVPHFNLLSGSYVFLCDIPKEFAEPSRRSNDRFNTSRFKNLVLAFPSLRRQYRIVDISLEGCKVYVGGNGNGGDEEKNGFSLGEVLNHAKITVGSKVEIDLEAVVPRSEFGGTVGIQFQIAQGSESRKYLSHFIKSLESSEQQRLHAEAE